MIATVEDGRLVAVRGDPDHPHSRGFLCAKASGAIEVAYDPDRVTQPLRRVGGPGEFEPVTWDVALSDITQRMRDIRDQHGPEAFATFLGNPPAAGYATAIWLGGFQSALQVKWRYGVNAEDASARMAASALLYGSVALLPKPDLWRTNLAVIIGANPLVSHGSLVTEARIREALDSVVDRGGRVIVIDPRRTQTARRYEHLAVRPGEDAQLLLGIIHTLFDEDLLDTEFVSQWTTGADRLLASVQRFPAHVVSDRCRVPTETIKQLARDFASAHGALIYGRTGTCTQKHGTLTNILQDTIMALTGNIERKGGWLFGWAPIDFERFAERSGLATFGEVRSRVRDHPDVFGMLPSTDLIPDILTPGHGQVRALMVIGGNPVLTSAGGGTDLEAALEQLDLLFSLDLYVNETNKHADYVLPVRHFYERDDFPLAPAGNMLRPALWATEPVIPPPGEVREEWAILDEIARRLGLGGAYASRLLRIAARLGLHLRPQQLLNALIRTSSAGDWYGLRRHGLNRHDLITRHPHGVGLRDELPTGQLETKLRSPGKKIRLDHPVVQEGLDRLSDHNEDSDYPLRLIGMRELQSQNSWMHNVARLMPPGRSLTARINPTDAAPLGITDGAMVDIASRSGTVSVPATITDDVGPGTVALPHGWGHAGLWQHANAAGGVNSNVLASSKATDLEAVVGMSVLNGIPIRLSRPGRTLGQEDQR